jgi:serine/threonine-protein kinase
MSDERWTIVDRLFGVALEREPHERGAFLDEACAGDEPLRREIESLLAHAGAAGDFLAGPALELVGRVPSETRDPSLVGRQLGPHRILSLLGIGGMGEVYHAYDSTLARDVAIKILPRPFTTDPERRARFDREARLLASLNHPHIGAIFGVEDLDGTPALILEFVDGDTLGDRLERGHIAIGEALNIARQIADALEAAHEKGIVHRDLKPANIKITHDLVVKVLDFGLAKAASGDGSGPDLTQAPAHTIGGTHAGVILGTATYMSPEQARGKPVDKRTDLWAFGCVLYEMLTGRPAFTGETISDTIAGILERDPDWRALPAATPPSVTRLLQRCLSKDPRRRLHDIADARIEIEDALDGDGAQTPAQTATGDRPRVRLPWAIAVVTSVAALIAVVALTWYVRMARQTQTAPPRISRMTIASSGTAAVTPNGNRSLAITPDGTRVVYVGNNVRQLFVHPLDRLDSVPLVTATVPLNWVFVSPNGQWVGFDEGGTLKKVALAGGPVKTVLNTGLGGSSGATWAPDDTIIFTTLDPTTGLLRVSADGGDVAVLTRPALARGELDHLWPEMLPGGRAVLFTITATGGPDAAQVAVLDLATGASRVVMPGGSHAHYVQSGHLIYTAGGTLRAVPFDLDRLETRGTPVTVLPRLVTKSQGAAEFVVAADGTFAYVDAPDVAAANTLVWVDRKGREKPLGAPPGPYEHPRVSPDGMRVAVVKEDDIWVLDLAGQRTSQLTFAPAKYFAPLWTKDGHRLLSFSPVRESGLFWQAADGTGAAKRLGTGLPSGVTPDGRHVIFSSAPGARDVMLLTLDASQHVEPLIKTAANERNGVVSANGRWVAYESDSSGEFEIYVKPFPTVKEVQWLVSTAGGTRPLWAPDGQELFFVAPDGSLMAVRVDARGSSWRAGSPVRVVEGLYINRTSRSSRNYDVSRDGQRFLMVKPPAKPAAAPRIIVVQNWFEELRRLVPAR